MKKCHTFFLAGIQFDWLGVVYLIKINCTCINGKKCKCKV